MRASFPPMQFLQERNPGACVLVSDASNGRFPPVCVRQDKTGSWELGVAARASPNGDALRWRSLASGETSALF
jgi:hypothetical protein